MLPRAWLTVARGNVKQNWKYCSKEGKVFIEQGYTFENKYKGDTDFLEMYEAMKTMTPQEFEENYTNFYVMHKEKVMSVMIENALNNATAWPGDLQVKNIWVWGDPGIGKSRWASSYCSFGEIYKKNFNKWWDGYQILNHKFVILEDYPSQPQGNVLAQHMKIWGDRYPFIGECKGTHIGIEPGRFFLIITSNYKIDDCFVNFEDKEAIHRRFHEIHMTNENALMVKSILLDTDILKS